MKLISQRRELDDAWEWLAIKSLSAMLSAIHAGEFKTVEFRALLWRLEFMSYQNDKGLEPILITGNLPLCEVWERIATKELSEILHGVCTGGFDCQEELGDRLSDLATELDPNYAEYLADDSRRLARLLKRMTKTQQSEVMKLISALPPDESD